jgi:type I restriction enzyme, S subunit
MLEERKVVRLGDLGTIVTGKTPSTKVLENFGEDTPFVTPNDMDGRKTISETARYLSTSGVKTVKNAVLPAGAVMVSCIGSDMGKAAIAGRTCVTNQQINSIIVSDEWCASQPYVALSRPF